MKHTEEDKKYILNEHLRMIWVLTEKEYQRKVWVRGEGAEVNDYNDYDETVCYFFDDGDYILEKYRYFNITEKQYQILKAFRDEFEEFVDGPGRKYYLPEVFIDKPEWAKIMESAKEVLKAFDYKKK